MAQDKTKQAPISDANADEWASMVKATKDLPELFPKLKFGDDKLAIVTHEVEFVEDTPRFVEYDDPYTGQKGRVMFINVRVVGGGNDTRGAMRALAMPAKPEHGLTRGITSVAKRHGNKLKGVCVRIETTAYDNKRYKTKTRGFNIHEITPPDDINP